MPDGRLARACGIVTVRQPEAAKGMMLVSLEDETGTEVHISCFEARQTRDRATAAGACKQ
ncbi:MAG: hypothetical protein A3E25_06620 [Burkholderiales bacterium RIFCSPHIGHO2_12_FULL_69_20]|nr:MAG: hypothetical protein A3E25_06620 [Burkholderiales bacterium RIFCSPHIGHO2_12_FULL_69_20]